MYNVNQRTKDPFQTAGFSREEKMKKMSVRAYLGLSVAAVLLTVSLAGCGSKSAPASPAPETETSAESQSGGKARELLEEFTSSAEAKEDQTGAEVTAVEETEPAEETAAENDSENTAEAAELTEVETTVEEAMEEETGDIPDGIPLYMINQRMDYQWDQVDGEYKQLSGTTYDCVYLTDEAAEAFPALDKALNLEAEKRIGRFQEEFKLLTGEARDMVKDGYPLYAPLSVDGYTHVHRADAGIFSYLAASESYWGGAHGDYGYGGYTYDSQTGRELELGDLVKDIPAMGELVLEKLRTDYDEQIFFESYKDTIHAYFDGKKDENDTEVAFTMEPDGISFWFGPYDLAAYASGMQMVHIRFDEAPELFDARCTRTAQENYVIEMSDYVPLKTDLGENGTMDEVLVCADKNEYGEYNSLHVIINGKDCEADNAYFYRFNPVYIRAYDHDILLVDTVTDNDYRIMYTFDLREDGAFYFGEENAAFTGVIPERFGEEHNGSWRALPADITHFSMSCRYDLLSTLGARRWYSIGAQDILIPETPYYDIENEYFELTTLRDLEFDRVDASLDKVIEKDVSVPKGTALHFFRSDLKTYTDMKDDDGNVFRVKMDDHEDWPPTINGYELMECFDGMMFAG